MWIKIAIENGYDTALKIANKKEKNTWNKNKLEKRSMHSYLQKQSDHMNS